MGTQSPSPKVSGAPPQFSAHFYCGQTAGWFKVPLGMDVGLSQGDFVLDGSPSPKGAEPICPICGGPFQLCPNGWMRQDATRYGGRPQPRRVCVRWGPSPLPGGGATSQVLRVEVKISKLDRKCGLWGTSGPISKF